MKVYLAGPMRGHPEFNYPEFHQVARILRGLGHTVLSPAESFGGETDLSIVDYARFDIHALLQVDALVLLPGWEESDGARRELVLADWLGLQTFRVNRADEGRFALTVLTVAFRLTAWDGAWI